jgi:hypothetical protein
MQKKVPLWSVPVVVAVLIALAQSTVAHKLAVGALLAVGILPPLVAWRLSSYHKRQRNATLVGVVSVALMVTLFADLAHAAPITGPGADLASSVQLMVLALLALMLAPLAVAVLLNMGTWLGKHPRFVLVCVAVALAALAFGSNLALAQSRRALDIPGSCPDPKLCKSAGLRIRKRTQTSRDKNVVRTAARARTPRNPGLAAQLLTTTRRALPEWTPCWRMEQLVRRGFAGRESTWADGDQRLGSRLVHTVWLQYYCKASRRPPVRGAQSYIEVTVRRGKVVNIQRQWH